MFFIAEAMNLTADQSNNFHCRIISEIATVGIQKQDAFPRNDTCLPKQCTLLPKQCTLLQAVFFTAKYHQ
jgi:hypothetical protein